MRTSCEQKLAWALGQPHPSLTSCDFHHITPLSELNWLFKNSFYCSFTVANPYPTHLPLSTLPPSLSVHRSFIMFLDLTLHWLTPGPCNLLLSLWNKIFPVLQTEVEGVTLSVTRLPCGDSYYPLISHSLTFLLHSQMLNTRRDMAPLLMSFVRAVHKAHVATCSPRCEPTMASRGRTST